MGKLVSFNYVRVFWNPGVCLKNKSIDPLEKFKEEKSLRSLVNKLLNNSEIIPFT